MISSLAHVRPSLLFPRPVRWLEALERVNNAANPAAFWRDIGMQVRMRGSKDLQAVDWPGDIYLPSAISKKMIANGLFLLPREWRSIPLQSASQFFSILAAWQIDRSIFEFTPRATEVLGGCTVHVPLTPQPFARLPAQAIYVDLAKVYPPTELFPYGFFATMDEASDGTPQMLLAFDFESTIEMQTIALNGRTVDTVISESLAAMRRRQKSEQQMQAEFFRLESLLHLSLSAILLTSSDLNKADVIEGHAGPGWRCPWTRWQVGKGIEALVGEKLRRAQSENGTRAVMVSEWRVPDAGGDAQLHCSVGYGYQGTRPRLGR